MKKTYFGNLVVVTVVTPEQAAAQELAKISRKIQEIGNKHGLDATDAVNAISNLIAQLG